MKNQKRMKKKDCLGLLCLSAWLLCSATAGAAGKKHLNIVFIGNSITHGAGLADPAHDAPPVHAAFYLGKQADVGEVKYANRGVSGCTTVDYLPGTGTLFAGMQEAADRFKDEDWATMVFSIMLGTNDSAVEGTNGCPVSPARYRKNMAAIIDRLLELYPGCKIVLHRPIWYSPNTYNSAMYLKEGLLRLQSYYPEIRKLAEAYAAAHPGQVFLGDTEGFDFFKENYGKFQHEDGRAGIFFLHPTEEGAKDLGELWGKAIHKAISDEKAR